MPTFTITPRQLSAELRNQARELPKVVRRGLYGAARRGQAHMVGKTPTDQGQLRNSWRATNRGEGGRFTVGATLRNEAPHAGIVELGARPHRVSADGMAALIAWAMRKLGANEAEAKRIAAAIAWKLRSRGQEPTFFVRNELRALGAFVGPEVDRLMRQYFARGPQRGGAR